MATKKPNGDKDKPDLEKIASEMAGIHKDYSVDQVLPAMYDAFSKHSRKVGSDGRVTYQTKFSSTEKTKIADELFDSLSYHVHINIYKMDVDEWKKMSSRKDPSGISYTDMAVMRHFGIDRDDLRKSVSKKAKLTPEVISTLTEEWMRHHTQVIYKPVLDKLEDRHMPYVKEWVKKKIGEYNLDEEYLEEAENSSKIGDLIPLYQKIAEHYKGRSYKKK